MYNIKGMFSLRELNFEIGMEMNNSCSSQLVEGSLISSSILEENGNIEIPQNSIFNPS